MNLYNHQQKIIDADPKKCGIFLGTGGGKTRTALSLARGRTLVICPKTQWLDQNWEREFHKLELPSVELDVISKEQFKKMYTELPRYDTVIIDEAHTVCGVTPNIRYRNKKPIPKASQIFEAVYMFIHRTKPDRIYLATATPARNPMAVWAAGRLLDRKMPTWLTWRRMFYTKLPMPGREVWQPGKTKAHKELLAGWVKDLGYTGRLQDWFDVPPQVDKIIKCELDGRQKEEIKNLPLDYPDPLVLIGKTHQAEQGESKIKAIEDLLEEYPKVLIFARYRDQIDRMFEHFWKTHPVFRLTGDTQDRKGLIADAERRDRAVFICQSQIATGFELPSFDCVVFASMSYSYVDHMQSRGRVLRANKLGKKLYVHLISGEMDQAVLDCIQDHKDFNEKIYAQRSGLSDKIQRVVKEGKIPDSSVRVEADDDRLDTV